MAMKEFWNTINLKENAIPEEIKLRAENIEVNEKEASIDDAKVFYREALPHKDSNPATISVLLLHGMRFSSKTWLDLKTISLLSAMGYHTVAVDLPGYANSPAVDISNKANFLHHLIKFFGLKCPVIVSPSMSGFYTLPYLLKHWKNMGGYIPVAPVGIHVLENQPSAEDRSRIDEIYPPLQEFFHEHIPNLSHIEVPTMVVFGEKDRSLSSALLSLLPYSQCQEIPNGGHPAYLDDPDLWHQLLYNFLHHVSEKCCSKI